MNEAKHSAFKVLLAGCGGMGHHWLTLAAGFERLRIVGLVDVQREAAEALAAKHGLPASIAFTDLAEAIDATGADVVFDTSSPQAHHDVVTTALAHGCHVLGEKPMSDSMAEARAMVAAAQEAQRLYAVSQNYRYQAGARAAAAYLRRGDVGPVRELHCEFFRALHPRGFRETMPDVLLVDMSIHHFDLSRLLSGCDGEAVQCRSWNPAHSWLAGDASAAATFELSGGGVFTYRASWVAEGAATSWHGRWRIVCDRGTLLWDGDNALTAEVVVQPGAPRQPAVVETRPVPVTPLAFPNQAGAMQAFIDALDRGTEPETVCRDSIRSLAMVDAAVRSARAGGERVTIDSQPSAAPARPAAAR